MFDVRAVVLIPRPVRCLRWLLLRILRHPGLTRSQRVHLSHRRAKMRMSPFRCQALVSCLPSYHEPRSARWTAPHRSCHRPLRSMLLSKPMSMPQPQPQPQLEKMEWKRPWRSQSSAEELVARRTAPVGPLKADKARPCGSHGPSAHKAKSEARRPERLPLALRISVLVGGASSPLCRARAPGQGDVQPNARVPRPWNSSLKSQKSTIKHAPPCSLHPRIHDSGSAQLQIQEHRFVL